MSRRMWVTGGGGQVAMFYRWSRRDLRAPRAAARLMTAGFVLGIKAERDRINRGLTPGTAQIRNMSDEAWKP